jgi:hypothetical protein
MEAKAVFDYLILADDNLIQAMTQAVSTQHSAREHFE